MTYGPPDPNQPPPGYRTEPPDPRRYPRNLWPDYAQPATPAPRPQGSAALGVIALFLSLAGLVAPFLPFSHLIDRFPVRQYLAFPFAVPALALAIATLAGTRRGKPAAAIAMMVAFLALGIGAVMVYNYDIR